MSPGKPLRRRNKQFQDNRWRNKPFLDNRWRNKPFQDNRWRNKPFQDNRWRSKPFQDNRWRNKPFQDNRWRSKPFQDNRWRSKPFQDNRWRSKPFQDSRWGRLHHIQKSSSKVPFEKKTERHIEESFLSSRRPFSWCWPPRGCPPRGWSADVVLWGCYRVVLGVSFTNTCLKWPPLDLPFQSDYFRLPSYVLAKNESKTDGTES
jgi:hypothetical protein